MTLPLPALGLFLALGAGGLSVPPREHLIEVWDADRGLPSSLVTSLAQTEEGYLWAGTHGGLARFDGARFVVFHPENTPELRHPRIEQLVVAPDGRLWISSYDGSLASYRDGRFTAEWSGRQKGTGFLASTRGGRPLVVFDNGTLIRRRGEAPGGWDELAVPPTRLDPVFADARDALWIRSSDHRLWRFTGERFEEASLQGLTGDRIRHLAADGTGRLWISTNREVAVWNGERFEAQVDPPAGEVPFFFPTRDGGFWGVAAGQPRRAREGAWVWKAENVRDLTGYHRLSLDGFEDRHGGVWVRHDGGGLVHVGADGALRRITAADGLPGDAVKACIEDREGNVWAAVDRGGLVRVREAAFRVLSADDGLAVKAVGTVAEDETGTLWFGTHGGGLHRLRDGALVRFAVPAASSRNFVFSLFPDGHGGLWLSGDREDLLTFDGRAIRRPPWGVHAIKSMLVDRAGRVWLGTKNGLACLVDGDLRGGIQYFGPDQGFEPEDVRAFAEAADGTVWMGTGGGNIYAFKDGAFTKFRPEGTRPGEGIWALQVDAEGLVWAGTSGGGLLRLASGRFSRFTSGTGLPSDVICQILDDGRGQLWAAAQGGLFSVSKASLGTGDGERPKVRTYGRAEGWPTAECSGLYQPSAWRARDGRLWFATAKGVVSVGPDEVTAPLPPPPVLIEDVRVNGEPADGPPRAPAAPIEVPPGDRRVELTYTGISLSAPERLEFRYQLLGLEAAWVQAGPRRSVQYAYLPPGEYRFAVAARYGGEDWGPAAEVALTVRPRLRERGFFLVLLAAAGAGLVGAGVRTISHQRLRRQLERLEWQQALERDRARISKDIHDDLGAGLSQIGLLSDLVQRDGPPHAQSYLEQISETARGLIRNMDEIVWAMNPRHDTLRSLVTYVCQFAQGYLSLAEIQCRLDIPPVIPPHPLTSEVRHNLFLAVKEALRNVVEHAGAREVWLRFRLADSGFTLSIEDDGRGFVPSSLAGEGEGRGEGLASLRDRLTAIGGQAVVQSEPGRGTRVALTVPRGGDVR